MQVRRLVCVAGPGAGREFPLDGERLTIGRSSDCEIQIPEDPNLSRRHARIERLPKGFVVYDLNSTNGTLVNRVAIDGPTALHHLDTIQVGMTTLRFEDVSFLAIPAAEPQPSEAPASRPRAGFWPGFVAGLALALAAWGASSWLEDRSAAQVETKRILEGIATKPRVDLFQAAATGDLAQIRAHIRVGSDLNVRDANGFTPLHLAAYKGHKAAVELLLEAGADPTVRSSTGATPEQVARAANQTEIANLLARNRRTNR